MTEVNGMSMTTKAGNDNEKNGKVVKESHIIGRKWIAGCPVANGDSPYWNSESGIRICPTDVSYGKVSDDTKKGSQRKFRLATYNILRDRAIRPGLYVYCPEEVRYMSTRYHKIMSEVKEMTPDIVCFQEMEYENYKIRIQPSMKSMGYQGVLLQSQDDAGLATFWKNDSFELLEQKHSPVNLMAETFLQTAELSPSERQLVRHSIEEEVIYVLVVRLRHVTSNSQLAVANTHITWSRLKFPALQALQISMGARELSEFVRGLRCAQIFCGDFNSPPDSLPYHLLSSGQLDDVILDSLKKKNDDVNDQVERLRMTDLCDVLPSATFTIPVQLSSAYKSVMGEEPAVTNCDDCGGLDDVTVHQLCLDYIWFCPESLEVTGVLQTPSSELIAKHYALPSIDFPSDHIPLLAEFAFK